MAYHDVVFPTDISYGSAGGPGFKTTIVPLDSGAELRYARWSTPRRLYDVAYGVKSLDQLSTLLDFFVTRDGALNSFKFKDFMDFTTATDHRSAPSSTDVQIGTGDGSTTSFQLKKTYASGAGNKERTITKPRAGTIVASLNDVASTAFSTNTETGVVTFSSPPGVGVIVKAGCEFYVHARFGDDVDESLMVSYDDFASGGVRGIEIVEVIDENVQPERFDYGGAGSVVKSSDFDLQVSSGRFQKITTTASGVTMTLPPAADLEPGGPHFYLYNAGSNSITVSDGSATVGTIAAGATSLVLVVLVGTAQAYHMVTL
jgi:uncharacterized protein (TIGR02217 family)